MIFRNFRIISAFVAAVLIISACEKNQSELIADNQNPSEIKSVPFFELAKGDAVSYRS
jgi:hypothetical protein